MRMTATVMTPPGLLSLQHPVWMCAMRPFFLLTMGAAVLLIALWSAVLALGLPPPPVAGGALVWHAHELLLGFGLAAVAGFVLTAVPEFTNTASASPRTARQLVLLWLLGRAGFWLSGAVGVAGSPALALAALAHLGLLGGLLALLWPALRTVAGRRHHAFGWALAGLFVLVAGFYADALRGAYPMRWLLALLGLVMVLIIVAMSRISMRIVNNAIDAVGGEREPYLARPPRRNLAVLCIGLHTVAQVLQWPASTSGWLALAAAAALLNLLNDWHVGRALLTRWPLMLYAVYVFMAAGYGLMGLAGLGLAVPASAGLHLLTAGAFGLAILLVLVIAGYTHSGLRKEGRPWVLLAATCVALAAVLRALSYALLPQWLLPLSGLLWAAGFALLAWHMLPVWLSPRADGAEGCAGVAEGPGG